MSRETPAGESMSGETSAVPGEHTRSDAGMAPGDAPPPRAESPNQAEFAGEPDSAVSELVEARAEAAAAESAAIRSAVNVLEGRLVCQAVADAFGMSV